MERRINRKIEDYISTFKDEIRNKISSLQMDDKEKAQFLVYLYEYPRLTLDSADVVKRKRVKMYYQQIIGVMQNALTESNVPEEGKKIVNFVVLIQKVHRMELLMMKSRQTILLV